MASRTYDQDSFQIIRRMIHLFCAIDFAGAGVPVLLKWNYPVFGTGPFARTYTAATVAAPLPIGHAYPLQYRAGSEGVLSVVRTGLGLYTLKLQDNYQRVVGLSQYFSGPAGAPTVDSVQEDTGISNMTGVGITGSIIGLQFAFAGNVADPVGRVNLTIILADATEP